ncbi:MAG: hypothetical protein AAF402_00025 [Pseudomonadota bacterium]
MNTDPNEKTPTKTLVEKASGLSLILAVVVFMANMVAAWWITGESTDVIGRPLVSDQVTATSIAMESAPLANANGHILLNRVINTELMLRAAQNRHTITVVALSVAFALVAIGFALFVMGAEGAFRLEGKVQDQGNLMVKATAPGLLCFVLAVIIVCFALLSKTDLELGDFSVYPDNAVSASGTHSTNLAGADTSTFAGASDVEVSAVVAEDPVEYVPPEPTPLPDMEENTVAPDVEESISNEANVSGGSIEQKE